MTRFRFISSVAVLLALLANAPGAQAATTNDAPDFKEVYDLVRAHLAGAGEAQLNRAAVDGLLAGLHGKVSLVGGDAATVRTNAALVSNSAVLEDDVAYVRVGRVDDGLAKELSGAYQRLSATNKLKGLALDLRFASGDDYAAATAAADLFVSKERPLLDWGYGVVKSKEKTDTISVPIAVLVNRETGGAAEALAAMLRETGEGLILGSTTAGQAMTAQEFPLANGQRLRIATGPVKLGDGTVLSAHGIKPDIEVPVSFDDERACLADAYAALHQTNLLASAGSSLTDESEQTNRPTRRPHLTEAELVREQREGTNLETALAPARDSEPEKPLIRDPVLARAVDLLKGLALVRASRS